MARNRQYADYNTPIPTNANPDELVRPLDVVLWGTGGAKWMLNKILGCAEISMDAVNAAEMSVSMSETVDELPSHTVRRADMVPQRHMMQSQSRSTLQVHGAPPGAAAGPDVQSAEVLMSVGTAVAGGLNQFLKWTQKSQQAPPLRLTRVEELDITTTFNDVMSNSSDLSRGPQNQATRYLGADDQLDSSN